ncbi:APC family permease [Actinophytocola algeriensis]|uniref:Amino acid transporter n=1 Tax=Actinophytocola algeriensis TaxID=1768010 RepID=A0A7W7VJF1_9PSEU|nr:APC family permease [Actinophytocola algeriensis]MBB4912567.1 amino acid transporter [Actinophytocola algeriensis]MBE1478941.1 amino acid transporter [Actinophytocola algeriensis]
MVTENTAAPEEQQSSLKRVMGSKLLYFFVIGDILGTGIYALTGTVAGRVGGALWLPFLLAFVVAFLTAFAYLELVGKYPKAAGAALYTNRAFKKPFVTFLVAFAVMCSGITSASAAAMAFGGTYLPAAFDFEVTDTTKILVAVAFIVLLAIVNFVGVAHSVKANVVLTIIELSGLAIIICVGLFAVGGGDGEPGRLLEVNTADQSWLLAITAATSLAFFAMVGFEDSVNMAEECQDPPRIFPKALLGGLATAAVIYVLVAVTSSLLVAASDLAAAESGALLKVIDVGAPGFPRWIFEWIGVFAVINSALINMLMASRLLYGMANERILPRVFGTVHPFRRTPWVSILVTSGIAVLLLIFAGTDGVSALGGTTALLLLCVFTVVNIAVLVLRKEKVEHNHFRAPTWAPVVGAVLCLYLVLPGLSGKTARDYYIGVGLIVLGIVLWGINWLVLRSRGEQDAVKEFDPQSLKH